jgi:xylulokinase
VSEVGREELLLALDVGTSGVKAGLFAADGSCRARCKAPLGSLSPRPGWSEMDLGRVWEAVVGSVRCVLASTGAASSVVGIGLSVTSPTVVVVGPDGTPLANAPTYADTRALPQLDRIREEVGEEAYLRLTGNGLHLALCSAASMLHLLDAARTPGYEGLKVGHLNSYLAGRLTGRWVMDWTNASYTGLADLRHPRRWSPEACEAVGFPEGTLPELVAPWEPIGRLSAGAAAEFGLGRSVPVSAGAADTACAAYAVRCVEDGGIFESSGTSGVLTICHSRPPSNPLFMNRSHVLPGRWLSHGAMSSVGAAIRWLEEEVFRGFVSRSGEGYGWVNAEAARSEPGAGGVVFLPYLSGERTPVWDPDARGAWVGLSASTGRHDLVRAVLESAGYGMRQLMEIEEDRNGTRLDEVLLVGGGARSDTWTQIRSDITGRRYGSTDDVEAASRGAAMLAAVGAGVHENVRAASGAVKAPETEPVEPTEDPTVREVYDRRYRVYSGLYSALEGFSGDLRWPGVREKALSSRASP